MKYLSADHQVHLFAGGTAVVTHYARRSEWRVAWRDVEPEKLQRLAPRDLAAIAKEILSRDILSGVVPPADDAWPKDRSHPRFTRGTLDEFTSEVSRLAGPHLRPVATLSNEILCFDAGFAHYRASYDCPFSVPLPQACERALDALVRHFEPRDGHWWVEMPISGESASVYPRPGIVRVDVAPHPRIPG